MTGYRKDIDGLRAIAVLAVILCHFGFLPNGYLGVDVFFVISGYLITGIIAREMAEGRFSIRRFYLRRIRRILPLVLLISLVALGAGAFLMLPDDLENLSESVIATNLFSNNILLFITTGNYWDIVNEYKPLMHTWSLSIEEQFYLVYPFLFLLTGRKRPSLMLPALLLLTGLSLALFLSSSSNAARFYLLPFRFFELSAGGLGALVMKDRLMDSRYTVLWIIALLALLLCDLHLPERWRLCLTVLFSLGVVLSQNGHAANATVLESKAMAGIGKISYSLYMFHQLVLSFTRYAVTQDIHLPAALMMLLLILLLSLLSYHFIEQPFRNGERIRTPHLIPVLSVAFLLSLGLSWWVYLRSGVLYDIPEMDIRASAIQKGFNARYNDRIYALDRDFSDTGRIKVLVVGNSTARDWANILLESKYGPAIDLSYVYDLSKCAHREDRLRRADYIFFSGVDPMLYDALVRLYSVDTARTRVVGPKNFGVNNGVFFNRRGTGDYCGQRTEIAASFTADNNLYRKQLGWRYIDLIGLVTDGKGTVPVFTPECKFISQDCRHLTRNGAAYFAHLLERDSGFKMERAK